MLNNPFICNFSLENEKKYNIEKKKLNDFIAENKEKTDNPSYIRDFEIEIKNFKENAIEKYTKKTYDECIKNIIPGLYRIHKDIQKLNDNKESKLYVEKIESLPPINSTNIRDVFKTETDFLEYQEKYLNTLNETDIISNIKIIIEENKNKINELLLKFNEIDQIKKQREDDYTKFTKILDELKTKTKNNNVVVEPDNQDDLINIENNNVGPEYENPNGLTREDNKVGPESDNQNNLNIDDIELEFKSENYENILQNKLFIDNLIKVAIHEINSINNIRNNNNVLSVNESVNTFIKVAISNLSSIQTKPKNENNEIQNNNAQEQPIQVQVNPEIEVIPEIPSNINKIVTIENKAFKGNKLEFALPEIYVTTDEKNGITLHK